MPAGEAYIQANQQKRGVPGARIAKALWGLMPRNLQEKVYGNPDAISLALMYATGKGSPIDIKFKPYQEEELGRFADQTKESEWTPSTNVAAGRTADKGYSHNLNKWIPRGLYDLLGEDTIISRHINPATKDTNYTYLEDWDLTRGAGKKKYSSGRYFNTDALPKFANSLLDLYQKSGYITMDDRNPTFGKYIGVTDKFINAGSAVPMNFPSIYRPYNPGNK